MEGPEPGYSWTEYVIRADLPEVPDDKPANIIQLNVAKMVQGDCRS